MQRRRQDLQRGAHTAVKLPIPRVRLWTLIVVILLLAEHRLPAPVVEAPETSPPAVEGKTAKPKHSTHSKRKAEETTVSTAETPRAVPKKAEELFAGNWSGDINQGLWGSVGFTLTFPASAS